MPARPIRRLAAFAAVALSLTIATPAHAGDQPEAKKEAPREQVSGRVRSARLTENGQKITRYVLHAGQTRYVLQGEAGALKKLSGKFVTLSRVAGERAWLSPITIDDGVRVELPKPGTATGFVRVHKAGTRKEHYTVEGAEGHWHVDARDARRFKKLVDLHVEVTAYLARAGDLRAFDQVKKVERKLHEGERDPAKGVEALVGSWRGVLTATRVPAGVPGARTGDFPVHFTATKGLAKVSGRLFDTYDVVGLEVKRFNRKKRTVELRLLYSFGKGDFGIDLEGTFAKGWKRITGEWTSEFLGGGTFVLRLGK